MPVFAEGRFRCPVVLATSPACAVVGGGMMAARQSGLDVMTLRTAVCRVVLSILGDARMRRSAVVCRAGNHADAHRGSDYRLRAVDFERGRHDA